MYTNDLPSRDRYRGRQTYFTSLTSSTTFAICCSLSESWPKRRTLLANAASAALVTFSWKAKVSVQDWDYGDDKPQTWNRTYIRTEECIMEITLGLWICRSWIFFLPTQFVRVLSTILINFSTVQFPFKWSWKQADFSAVVRWFLWASKSFKSLWSVIVSHGTVLGTFEVAVWKCQRRTGCCFKVISWFARWLWGISIGTLLQEWVNTQDIYIETVRSHSQWRNQPNSNSNHDVDFSH
jgi:hypothetical protein